MRSKRDQARDDTMTGTRRFVGGPRDGQVQRCIPASRVASPGDRWSLFIAGMLHNGGRHTYELDVTSSTGEHAVYRYVGHLLDQEVRRAR